MARPRVIMHRRGIEALLKDPGVERHLEGRMAAVLAQAEATAPRDSGAYVASLGVTTVQHPTRVVARVFAAARHALAVEGKHGVLSRALDRAGGRQ